MKKKIIIYAIASVMVFGFAFQSFAADTNASEEKVYIKDSAVATEMQEKNIDGTLVTIKIGEDIVDEINGADIQEILNNGLGTTGEQVEIISAEAVRTGDIVLTTENSYYIFTDAGKLVGLNISEDVTVDNPDMLLELAEDDNVKDGDIVTVQNIVEAEEATNENKPEKFGIHIIADFITNMLRHIF